MAKRFLAAIAAALMIVMAPASAAAAVPAAADSDIAVLAAADPDIAVLAAAGPGGAVSDTGIPAAAVSDTASLKKDSVSKTGLPGSFRLSCDEWSASRVKKVGERRAAQVSRQGLDTLRVSGSGQPSPAGLALVKEEILKKAPEGTEIWIVDLRQETHFYADDAAMIITDSDNTANRGMSTEEVLLLEQETIRTLAGGELAGKNLFTEQQAAEALGMHYVRFAITDHYFPEPDMVDEIVRFYHALPENAWVHFHCRAGHGRTTSLCLMFDILRNPYLDYETLALRQYLLGGKNLLEKSSGHSLDGILKKQPEMLPLFYQYVNSERFSASPLSWSEWLRRRETDSSGTQQKVAGIVRKPV